MAVTQNPIVGRSKNKFGNAIFQKWKDKNVLRTKPLQVANPNTDKQQAQRGKLAQAVALYRQISGLITIGYKSQSASMSEYNAFIKHTLNNSFDESDPLAPTLDWESLQVSKGSLMATPSLLIDEVNGANAIFVWDNTAGDLIGNQSLNDLLYGVAITYSTTTNEVINIVTSLGGVARSAGTMTISSSTYGVANSETVFYLFFTTPSGDNADNGYQYTHV